MPGTNHPKSLAHFDPKYPKEDKANKNLADHEDNLSNSSNFEDSDFEIEDEDLPF